MSLFALFSLTVLMQTFLCFATIRPMILSSVAAVLNSQSRLVAGNFPQTSSETTWISRFPLMFV